MRFFSESLQRIRETSKSHLATGALLEIYPAATRRGPTKPIESETAYYLKRHLPHQGRHMRGPAKGLARDMGAYLITWGRAGHEALDGVFETNLHIEEAHCEEKPLFLLLLDYRKFFDFHSGDRMGIG